MTNKIKSLSLILSFVFCLATITFGQADTAQISGNVVDATGAVVPGASVTITSTKTGFTRTTTTNNDGYYTISNVQPSTYEVSVKSGNFQEFKVTREISVASDVTINATLSATAGQTVVDVVASGADIAEVNISDQTVSEVINTKQLIELPTITRNPYDFVTTLGNVSEGDNGGRGVGVAINGQRSASTSILLNGGENVDTFTATVGQTVPLDSVQEFRVVTGTFTADFGRATGGVVNLVTKSGQNRFFGSAYIFNRNSRFASAGFDANARFTAADRAGGGQPRQFFNRNQFGGSLGGPIIKNKLLFFTNTELTRIRSTASITALVPSATSLALAAPATRNFFAAYTLNATRTGVTQSASSATRTLIFDQVRYSAPANTGAGTPVDGILSANRIDWNISDNIQLYGVYSLDKSTFLEGSNANSPYAGFNTGALTNNQNIQVASTYSFTNSLVGVTRFTFNKLAQEQPLGAQPAGPTLYFLNGFGVSVGGTQVAFPGYLPFSPGSAIPFGGPQKVYNLSQEFNYNIGNHLIKVGGQYYKINDNRKFGAYQNAVEALASNNRGLAVDNFFNGMIEIFQAAINPQGKFPGQTITLPAGPPEFARNNTYNEFALYGQDSFRLFPGFTANVGLRYEFYGPQRNDDRNLDSNFYFGGDGTFTAANLRTGSVQIAPNSPVKDLWKADKNNFAPSVGFAYDIEGNGKSSLRAGYALRYERNFGNVTFNVIQNPPNYAVISLSNTPITLNNTGPLAGTGTVILPATSLRAVDPNIVNSYAHQYSASFERRFGQLTASATFSGTTGKSLYSITNINRRGAGRAYLGSDDTTRTCSPAGTSAAAIFNQRSRLNCQYGDINFRGNQGYSSYQGITFAVESGNLFGQGLTMASRYTYAVSRDNLSTTFSETGQTFYLGFQDSYNPSLDYGFADFDVRHRFITNFVWDLPTNKTFSDGVGKAILGGFTFSGIVNVQSGTPFTVYDCYNAFSICTRLIPNGSLSFNGNGNYPSIGTNSFRYIDLSNQRVTELNPANPNDLFPGENGFLPENMTARNAFRGPGFWNVDLALSKRVFFSERMNLQFRIDATNVFNHANLFVDPATADVLNYYNFTTGVTSGAFVGAEKRGRRQIQLGLRFTF